MAGAYTHGTVNHGASSQSFTLSDGSTAVTGLVVEEFSLQQDSTVIEPKDANGIPTANLKLIPNRDKVTMTVQTSSTALDRFTTFTRNSVLYVVDSISTVESNSKYHIQNLTALRTNTLA